MSLTKQLNIAASKEFSEFNGCIEGDKMLKEYESKNNVIESQPRTKKDKKPMDENSLKIDIL